MPETPRTKIWFATSITSYREVICIQGGKKRWEIHKLSSGPASKVSVSIFHIKPAERWGIVWLFFFFCYGAAQHELFMFGAFQTAIYSIITAKFVWCSRSYKRFGKFSTGFTHCLWWEKKSLRGKERATLDEFSPSLFFLNAHLSWLYPARESALSAPENRGGMFAITAITLTSRFTMQLN